MSLSVGQEVIATREIWDTGDDHPPFICAHRGDKLIVRSVESPFFYAYVSHPEITDNSFGVDPSEIETVAP